MIFDVENSLESPILALSDKVVKLGKVSGKMANFVRPSEKLGCQRMVSIPESEIIFQIQACNKTSPGKSLDDNIQGHKILCDKK